MAVTKEQMAQWSSNYEQKYKGKKKEDTYHPSVTQEQMDQWEQNYQTRGKRHAPTVPKASAQSVAKVNEELADPMLKGSSPTLRSSAGNWLSGTRVLGTVGTPTAQKSNTGSTKASGQGQKTGTSTGSPVTTDRQEDYEPDWNYVGGTNTPAQRTAQVQEQDAKKMHRDDFDKWNQWMDADPKHRKLVDLMQEKKQDYTSYAERGTSAGAVSVGSGSGAYTSYAQQGKSRDAGSESQTQAKYTDADLLKMGYSQKEIYDARQYLKEYPAYNPAATFTRRTADWAKGLAGTVASAPWLLGENIGQTYLNYKASAANRKALEQAVQASPREKKLYDALQETDMDYQAKYSTGDLLQMGFTRQEIEDMRARIAGTEVHDSVPKELSTGYKLAEWGNKHTNAWLSGMNPTEKAVASVAGSAAENLAVAAVAPELVLPVLSAQGGADSMYQGMEKDESAGKTLVGGVAKFGAGWAINSVGAADLARTMGSDYAKDTLAGQIADAIRKVGGDSEFAKAYPAVANALSGGIDNAMQAFVETYADTAIDAVIRNDQQAAEDLLKPETFWTAFESGLTGGASGALGGAVGTGLARYNDGNASLLGQAQQADYETRAEQAAQQRAAMQAKAEERTEEPSQLRSQPAAELLAAPPKGEPEVEEVTTPVQEQTAPVSDNAAVQQFEQVVQAGNLTGKTIGLFTPNAANAENRAAFAQAYGVELPDTAAATRRALREIAAQRAETAQTGAETAQTGTTQQESAVEKAGETVESPAEETPSPLQSADAELQRSSLGEGAFSEGAEMRETIGLRQQSLTEKQRSVQKELTRWKVSEGASQTISRMVPDSITDLDRYTAAASTLYRLGQMEDVTTFDRALELARGSGALAPYTDYVLQQPGGSEALRAAWTQGHGELEAGTVEQGALGGALSEKSTSGEGVTYWKNSARTADDMATQLISLNARGTGTDAVLKSVLTGPDGSPSERVRGYIDTVMGRIFFSDRNSDVFSTILHEDYHWYNALDQEGGKALQDTALAYLAKNLGYEKVDSMIRDKMADYAAQGLTYAQAAEELVADSWSGIFDSVEDMTRWAQFQREQAEKNEGKAGVITKAVNAVKEMLDNIISRAKEVLTKDPENRAALRAERLAREEKRALQDAYFAHAEKAMENLRAAKENAAAIEGDGAAKEVRFKLHEGKDSLTEQMNKHLNELEKMETVAVIRGTEVLFGKDRTENIVNITNYFNSLGGKVEREGFGIVELTKSGARATVEHGNSKAKQVAIAAAPKVIQKGIKIGFEKNWQGRGYDTHVFAAPVEINGTKLFEGVIVREYVRQNGMKNFYVHEVCWTDGSYVTFDDTGNLTKKEDTPTQLPKAVRGNLADAQEVSSDTTIAQNDAPVKKNIRFQLDEAFENEVDKIDLNATWSKRIRVGSTSEVLQSIGVRNQSIYWDSGKIRKILTKHSAENFAAGTDDSIMTKEIIKQVPQVLEKPVIVLHSDTSRNADYASRIYMFGEVYDATGKPVDVSLELLPTSNKGLELDNIMVTSAYGKRNVQGLLNRDEILYIDPNKKRTDTWLAVNRLQLPLRITRYGSIASLRYEEGNVKNVSVVQNKLAETKDARYQLTDQADREAKQSDQRQASRAIADKAAALDTLGQFFGLTRGVKVSQDSLDGLAVKWTRTNGSRADRTKLAAEARVLVEYLKADGADMAKAQSLAETLAGEVLDGATYRNSELWDEYPELHKLEYTVNKTGQAKAELVRRYGSWGEAVAEARRHGVTLRQAEGVRDGNPAEQYESIVNDTRATGGTRDGARALWKTAAQQAGVAGAASMESTEWLDVLMNLHDAIQPKMMSRFADDAEYEDARVELAGRMLGDVMAVPEMTDAQAIFEGILAHNMQVAKAAAGSEEQAAAVEKSLKGIQKGQKKLFKEKLYQNQRAAGQHTEVQTAQANAKAERQLNDILETQGVDITNMGDLNEKLTVLRESYERQWKEEKKRLKAERQEMLDEARMEIRQLRGENADLARQVKAEQRRADKAEYSLIVQEDEIRDWELMNQQKAAEWYQKQAERNAIALEVAKQQRDEDIRIAKEQAKKREQNARKDWERREIQKMAEWYQEKEEKNAIALEAERQQRDEDVRVAKALAEKRVQKAREGRKMDEVRRSIRSNAAALNQLVLRPSPGKYVQQSLVVQAAEVAKMADMTILNAKAVNQLTALEDSIRRSMGSEESPNAMTEDWTQSKVPEMIAALRDSLDASKQEKLAKLKAQLAEAEAVPDSEEAEKLRDRLRARIRETENRTYLPMTLEQMQMLKAITSSTLHVIRTANKTLSLAKAEEVDKIATGAAGEVQASKGNHPGGVLDGLHSALTKYNLDMLGAERVFRMLGGYAKDGQMEKLAKMLNDGQRRQTEITVQGEKLFADVTGEENLKAMETFAGPGAELVDIGLTDTKGNAVPLTHAQLCSLYMHLQNRDSLEHLMTGGMTLPDAKLYAKGDIEQAYQKGQTVLLGMLTNADGTPMADTIANAVEKALTDYDRAWIADMKDFFGSYTTNLINETSMQLLGYNRAQVKNYYPIAVDKGALATQIEGLKLDGTIEGRGFLKNRVKSSKPILLEECSSVVQRSLRDTAAYAGLALPIRDVQKVLNSNVETADGLANLKNGVLKEQWGTGAVNYVNDLLTDLQTTQRKRDNFVSRTMSRLRGNYAGAILTLNPGVAIAQAASLPTAGAVLGMDTMAAVMPFVKNRSAKQRAAMEAEIDAHGDALLAWRKRGSQRGELASIGRSETLVEKGMDKLPKALTGWINWMDERTVAALWEGSKQYVKNHTDEFADGAAKEGSEDYWAAVNQMYQKVIEQTQPNYTVMQRAGIQRNPDEMVKTFTMFTTQRFQNYGILADAVMDYKAQKARDAAGSSEETRSEVQRAGKQLQRAAVSQAAQTAVFALMKIGADFLLHRWDKEQDENGDVTLKSLLKKFTDLFCESAAGNFLGGSELYSLVSNAVNGKDYDVISATNISVVNDLAGDVTKWFTEWRKDTSSMDEADLAKHHAKLQERTMNLIEDCLEVAGVPYGNGKKMLDAVQGYWDDIQTVVHGGTFTFNSLPESATGQYDRLYNAYASGDKAEAQAAMEKLVAMGKEDEAYKQLKSRLVKYDANVEAAAKAQNAGNDAERAELTRQIVRDVYTVLGIRTGVDADAAKRTAVINMVTGDKEDGTGSQGAINQKAEMLLKGDNAKVTDDLVEALDSGRASEVQQEIDRLLTAGKDVSSVKSAITKACKPEYVAGSDYDRSQMDEMLLGLVDADGKALYTQKTLDGWVTAAKKEAEKEPEKDPLEGLR